MLGRDHALSAAVVILAAAPVLGLRLDYLPAAAALTAGAGVLPDVDHPDATVSRSFGFLTEAFAWLVCKLSGGHRHGTHSLAGIAVFTLAAYLAGWWQIRGPHGAVLTWHMLPAMLFLTLLYSAGLRALHVGGHHGDLLGIAAAAATCFTGADLTAVGTGPARVPLLALAVALGCAAHIAGDMLTHSGCPVWWPFSQRDCHLLPEPLRFTTGKGFEHWIVSPLLTAALGLVLARDAGGIV